MNKQIKTIFVLAFSLVMSVTSCLHEASDTNGGENVLPGNVESLDSQVAAMKTSVSEMESMQSTLAQMADYEAIASQFEACAISVKEHIASVEAGMSDVKATLAAMKLQGQIAAATGALKAQVALQDNNDLQTGLLSVENGVSAWLGKDFKNYFAVAAEQAKLGSMLMVVENQTLSADAIASDVEVGLRVGDATGLKDVVASVKNNSEALVKLNQQMTSLCSEVETSYTDAIQSPDSNTKSVLKSINTKAEAAVSESVTTLADLARRISACETKLEEINTRLEKVKADVAELLGMIQSVVFFSEFTSDKAVAYYTMSSELNADRAGEGKKDRIPASTFDLNFLVRPAAAVVALTEESIWNDGLSVIGYYARQIQLASVNSDNLIDFEVEDVQADPATGKVAVTVKNAFSDAFYFKEIGAKLALSIESNKNSCTSKFVEIVPADVSGKVYAESLTLNATSISIQEGDTYQLTAVVSPSNVTDKGCTWNDYDSEYVDVDANGKITATAVGKSQVVVYANATDEFGRQLSAKCDVEVTPAIRIVGSGYVEVGRSITLDIDTPNYIDPQYVKWNLEWAGNSGYLGLEQNGDGSCTLTGYSIYFQPPAGSPSGSKSVYQPINVVCTIEGATPVVLTTGVMVVALQPKAIAIDGLAHDNNKLSLKKGETFQCVSTVQPDGVNMDWFSIIYQSNQTAVASVDFRSGLITANAFGTTTIDIKLSDKTSESYFYPNRDGWARTLAVTVEPYWVQSMTLPETYKMAPDAVATLTPDWTSDVEGVAPSDQTLTWTSSDPSVIEINPTTGQMTALKEGTSTITATTSGSNSVPSGSEHKTASCFVTVEVPTVPINIGDFYYSDGTWSTTRDYSKTVIGIVFAKADATGSDIMLRRDYPNATHGLVVSLTEFSNQQFGEFKHEDVGDKARHIYTWIQNNYSYDIGNVENIAGYTNSIVLNAYREAYHDYDYCPIFDDESGLAAQLPAHQSKTASPWYIPSYKEMSLLRDALNRDDVNINDKIQIASGTQIDKSADYWLSSMYVRYNYYYDTYAVPYSMSNGGWKGTSNLKTGQFPVRVVLAF